jgi:hypothetical protein
MTTATLTRPKQLTDVTPTKDWDPCAPSPRMFWEFCAVRQEEWWNSKSGEPRPWSADPVMAHRPPPNVFRELDRECEWLHENLVRREPRDVIFGSIAFRLTNRIPPHETFGGTPRADQVDAFMKHLYRCRDQGMRLFTRIFHTPSLGQLDETLHIISEHIDPITEQFVNGKDMQESYYVLHGLPRVRNFFAWQCTADSLEAGIVNHNEDSWCYLGPGPLRAFHMMYGRKFSQKEGMVIARRLRDVQHKALRGTRVPWQPPPQFPELTLKNIEHALCEYLRWTNAHLRYLGR